jgi:hypothetical protein
MGPLFGGPVAEAAAGVAAEVVVAVDLAALVVVALAAAVLGGIGRIFNLANEIYCNPNYYFIYIL